MITTPAGPRSPSPVVERVAGWYNGWLWQPLGIVLLLLVLLTGGLALLLSLRRSASAPGPVLSTWIGGLFGAISLLVLIAVA